MAHLDDGEKEAEEFEAVDDEDDEAEAEDPGKEPIEEFEDTDKEPVEEFEEAEEEEEPEAVEEFEGFDENAPDEIKSSGFQAKVGEIPGYEPTVEEVLHYALGKTKDPSEPVPPKEPSSVGDSLSSILTKSKAHMTEDVEEDDADVAELLEELGEVDEAEPEDEPEGEGDEEPGEVVEEATEDEPDLGSDELTDIFDDEERE